MQPAANLPKPEDTGLWTPHGVV